MSRFFSRIDAWVERALLYPTPQEEARQQRVALSWFFSFFGVFVVLHVITHWDLYFGRP